jgi:hypothetical protein
LRGASYVKPFIGDSEALVAAPVDVGCKETRKIVGWRRRESNPSVLLCFQEVTKNTILPKPLQLLKVSIGGTY